MGVGCGDDGVSTSDSASVAGTTPSAEASASTERSKPTPERTAEPTPERTAEPTPEPTTPPDENPTLSDSAAFELADQAVEPYALATFASAGQVVGCDRIDASSAICIAEITYEIVPGNPQGCAVDISVVATTGKVGSKPWAPDELEQKDLQASDGTLGRPELGDTSECEAAYASSAQ
jgi:hypothetical protein